MPPTSEPLLRSRMPVACAECRRLKLKCDKNKPCSSCIRRGCASICPQGRMVSKGSRFILANTEQLHEKIDALIGRVRQLENALEASYLVHSKDPHPLLCDELRLIATPIDSATPDAEPVVKEEEDLAENMGTLTLDSHGTRYFGSTGAFAYMWRDKDGADGKVYRYEGEVLLALAELPADLAHMAHAFPIRLPTPSSPHLGEWILENCLPPFPEAWSLFENYWEHYAWHFSPFTRSSFVEQIFSPIYHRSPDNGDKPLGHRLGLLFMVFAIGDVMDFTRPFESSTGLRYYLIARASLCLNPVFESPTVTALQAMYLMGVFLMMSRGTNEPEHVWVLAGLNLKVALTLGLNHDPSKFSLSPDETEGRQQVLISVVCAEIWMCLNVGRPPTQSFLSFDWVFSKCQPEGKVEDPVTRDRRWTACFIRDCAAKVLETTVENRVTSYSAILQLDAKIREYPEDSTAIPNQTQGEELGVGASMQLAFKGLIKDVSLLFLHRRFFAMALRDSPDDPLRSPFAPSVMACHNSATNLVSKFGVIHAAFPALTLRIWFIWPNIFVATLVLGSIVARSPGCSLASPALLHLEAVCRLWETASDTVCGAKVWGTVKELRRKAFLAFAQNKAPRGPLGAAPGGLEILDEIHALGGGGPRVISTTPQSGSSSSSPFLSDRMVPSEASQSPPSSIPTEPSPPHVQCVEEQQSSLFVPNLANNPFPIPFDFPGFDFSSQVPNYGETTLPNDFSEFFTMGDAQAPPAGSTILEELGLGGGWQPVMDGLGL